MKHWRAAFLLTTLGTVLAPSMANGIIDPTTTTETPKKVFVCKYVGTPGVDEVLQTGQNPISVSVNAIPSGAGIGGSFADAQGRSLVIAFDEGQATPTCPAGQTPPPTTTVAETTTTSAVTTTTGAAPTTTASGTPNTLVNNPTTTAASATTAVAPPPPPGSTTTIGSEVLPATTIATRASSTSSIPDGSTSTTAAKSGSLPATGSGTELLLRIGAAIFAAGICGLLVKRFHPGILFRR